MADESQVKIKFAGEDDGFAELARKEVEQINAVTAAREASNRAERQRLGYVQQLRQVERDQRKAAFDRLPLEQQVNELLKKRDDLQRRLNNGLPKSGRVEAGYQATLAQANFQLQQKSIELAKELANRPTPPKPPTVLGRISGALDSTFGQLFSANVLSQVGFRLQAMLSTQIRKAIDDGARFTDLADRLRTDTSTAQGISYASGMTALTDEDSAVGIKTLRTAQERALAGNKKLIESFDRYGVSVEQLRNKKADALYIDIARNIANGAGKTATMNDAMALFGRSADKVIGAFRSGFSSAFDDISAKGGIIPPDVVQDLDALKDQFDELAVVLTAKVAPAVAAVLKSVGPGSGFFKSAQALFELSPISQAQSFVGALAGGASIKEALQIVKDIARENIGGLLKTPAATSKVLLDDPEAEAAERVRVLKEKLNEIDKAAAFERLSIEEKITALRKEQTELGKSLNDDAAEEERLNVAIGQAELEKKIAALEGQRKEDSSSERLSSQFNQDALTRIGGFRNGTPDPTPGLLQRQIQNQLEQLRELKGIESHTRKVAKS